MFARRLGIHEPAILLIPIGTQLAPKPGCKREG